MWVIELPLLGFPDQWREVCRPQTPEAVAEVVRILLAAGLAEPGQLRVRRVEP